MDATDCLEAVERAMQQRVDEGFPAETTARPFGHDLGPGYEHAGVDGVRVRHVRRVGNKIDLMQM